jgi:CubicO group peptidase (beta-lactamase class C family)
VRKYIPEFTLYDPYVSADFTIRDLLTHRSGMGLGAGDLMFFPDGSDFTIDDIIHNLRYLKQTTPFRTQFDYDNNLYLVAGEIVRRVSGMSWPAFTEERIFSQLGMNWSAAAFKRLRDTTNIIDAHAPVDGIVKVIDRNTGEIMAPAGGINSCISDLAKWVTVLLNEGKHGSKRLFSEAVYRELTTPHTLLPVDAPGPYNTHFAAYGLGLFLSDVKGYKQLSHTGGLEGMVTQVTIIPELQLGIIVLTNQQEGGAFSSITNQIKDGYLGIPGTDRVTEYSTRRKKQLADAKVLTDSIWTDISKARQHAAGKTDFSVYAGRYRDAWLGEISVSVRDGKWWFASKRSPRLQGEMFFLRGNTFVVKWTDRSMDADAYINFRLDETGKATGASMKAISPLTDFSYDFHDLDLIRMK